MIHFNILYTDYKDQQIYRRSVKCDIDHEDTTYSIKYTKGHISKKMYSTVEKSVNLDKHVHEYTDSNGNVNYRVNLLPTNDMAIYTNINLNEGNDVMVEKLFQSVSNMLFVNIPKNECVPDNLNIIVDNDKLDELIEEFDYEIITSSLIIVHIYDKYGIFNLVRKYEDK